MLAGSDKLFGMVNGTTGSNRWREWPENNLFSRDLGVQQYGANLHYNREQGTTRIRWIAVRGRSFTKNQATALHFGGDSTDELLPRWERSREDIAPKT